MAIFGDVIFQWGIADHKYAKVSCVVKNGDYLIIGGGDYIDIVDISTPSAPVVCDRYDTPIESGWHLLIDEDDPDLFYAAGEVCDRLLVLDMSDPDNLVLRDSFSNLSSTGGPNGLVKVGNYLYITGCRDSASEYGVRILNVADPDNVVDEGMFKDPTNCPVLWSLAGIASLSNGSFIFCGAYGIYIYNPVGSPTAPVFVGKCNWSKTGQLTNKIAVDEEETYAYCPRYTEDRVEIIDISDPANPSAETPLTGAEYVSECYTAQVIGDHLFVSVRDLSNDDYYVSVFDISTRNSPVWLEALDYSTKFSSAWDGVRWGWLVDEDDGSMLYIGRFEGTADYGFGLVGVDLPTDGIYVTVDGTRIDSKVLSARTERGRDEELGQAQTGIAEITCDNSEGDFSPENAGGAYYGTLVLGVEMVIYEIYKGVTYNHFKGKVDKILPHAEWDNRVAYIVALDGMDDMAGTEIRTVLRQDTDTGELCEDVLDAVGWPAGDRDIDTGVDVLQYGWFHRKTGLAAIQDLEQIEKGFFYVDVDGTAIWENRHHRLTGDGLISQADFEDTMVELGYEFSKRQVRNQVTITGRRYFAGSVTLWSGYDLATLDDDLIWSAHTGDVQAPYIPQATTVTLWAEWREALATYDALVKGTHWNANTKGDKTGADVSDNITITATQYGQCIKFEIANAGTVGAYMVVPDSPPVGAPAGRTLLVYGALFGSENIIITKEDGTSQTDYGVRSLPVDAPFKSNPNDIRALAEYLLARFKDPVPDAVFVKLIARTGWPDDTIRIECLSRAISDRITLKSTLLGFDRDFFINKVIQEYIFQEGGTVHETTWYVERAEGAYEHLFWLLGVAGFGELGEATYLGI